MKLRGIMTAIVLGALTVMTQAAVANVIACRSQCTTDHQSCAVHCDEKACVARCASTFNACIQKCDQAAKTR
jgi:hypothetical protein